MLTSIQKGARTGYLASGSALVAGIYLQFYLATHAVSVQYGAWSSHVSVGRGLLVPILLMLLCAALGKLPQAMMRLTVVTLGLYLLQYVLMALLPRLGLQDLTALHGVAGLALYTVAHKVVIDAFRHLRSRNTTAEVTV